MGHDISGFKSVKDVTEGDGHSYKSGVEEIAYLRFSAFDHQARDIYNALGASEYDGGCSGDGSTVFFTKAQLKNAKTYLKGPEYERERKFLSDILDQCDKDGAWIGFY